MIATVFSFLIQTMLAPPLRHHQTVKWLKWMITAMGANLWIGGQGECEGESVFALRSSVRVWSSGGCPTAESTLDRFPWPAGYSQDAVHVAAGACELPMTSSPSL